MDEQEEQVRRAIGTLLQSDPLIKLLQEVRWDHPGTKDLRDLFQRVSVPAA